MKLYTSKEAAEIIGLTDSQFKHLVRKDRRSTQKIRLIPVHSAGRGRGNQSLFKDQDVQKFAEYFQALKKLKVPK